MMTIPIDRQMFRNKQIVVNKLPWSAILEVMKRNANQWTVAVSHDRLFRQESKG